MAEAIVYCDRCGRLVPPSDLDRGTALKVGETAFCSSCASALDPAERRALVARAGKPVSQSRRTPSPRPVSGTKQLTSRPASPASRAGMVLALGGGFGLAVGIGVALVFLGKAPPPEQAYRPPAAGPTAGAHSTVLPVSMPTAEQDTPWTPAGEGSPQVVTSKKLEQIRSMLDASFSRYDEVTGALRELIAGNLPPAELEEAKKLLAKVESDYFAFADSELKGARKTAEDLVSKGRYSDAISVLRLVGARFSGSDWYRSRGEAEITSAIAEIEKLRSPGAGEAAGRCAFDVNFNADEPDARPSVATFDPAGVNRLPTGMTASETDTVLVRRSSSGLADRPVELSSRNNGDRAPQLLFEFDKPVGSGIVRFSWESAIGSYKLRTDGAGQVETVLTFRFRNRNTDPIALVSYVHDSPDGSGGAIGIDCVAPNPQWAIPRHEARWKVGGPPDRFDVQIDLDALSVRVWRNGSLLIDRADIIKDRVLDGLKGLEITDGWAVGGGNGSFVAAVDNVKIVLGGTGLVPIAPVPAKLDLDADPALLAWWKLDELPGSTVAADSSGRGNAGALTNMDVGSCWVRGKADGGLRFDGIDDYVSVNTPLLDDTSEFTIAAWVKTEDLSRDGTIFAKGGWNTQEKILLFRDEVGNASKRTDTYKISVKFGGTEVAIEGRSGACADSGWHHVAATFVGGKADGLRLYIDGAEDPNSPVSTLKLPRLGRTGLSVSLGKADSNPLKGALDDVRVYTRALSAQEIAAIYTRTGGPARLSALDSDPALVGWWKLDESGGLSAQDSSGKGNTGTLENCSPPLWSPTGGRIGGALGFDGMNDRVNCGNSASLNTSSLTVAFWMKANALANQSPVDKLPMGTGCGWVVKLRDNGAVWFRIGAEPGLAKDVYGSPNPPEAYTPGKWVHIAATFDNNSKLMRLYVNGAKVAHEDTFDTTLLHDNTPLILGNTSKSPPEPFGGLLDDVRIYSRALSGEEILALYTGGGEVAPAKVRPSGALDSDKALIGWWPLDDGPGSAEALDVSKKIGPGRLTNMDLASAWVAGKLGMALAFDGSNDWVNCGSPEALATISELTVAAWVKPDDTDTHGHGDAIVSREGGLAGFQLTWRWMGSAGRFGVLRDRASELWGASDKSNGVWYHVAFTYSGGMTYLYVNGTLEASGAGTISPTKEPQPLSFGSHGGAGRFLRAHIDDIRIYSRALSAQEIAELYASADALVSELAPTAEARKLLAKDLSADPTADGYRLDFGILQNLRRRFDRTKVAPKKLAAIGGSVAANSQFDTSLRGGLKPGDGYVFAGRLGLAEARTTLDSIRKGLERALEREKAELVRVVPDAVDIVRGRSVQAIRGDIEAIANAVLDAGAIPVLFTPALPKATGDKKLDDAIASVAEVTRNAAKALNVPCLDAFSLLNADSAASKKFFAQGGILTKDGFELLGAKFLPLYRALERWVMGRGLGTASKESPGPVPGRAALVSNGGFEDVNEATKFASLWSAHQWGQPGAQYSVRLDRSNVHSGERALMIQAVGEGAQPGAFTTLAGALEPGRYELRFWACADIGKSARVHANIAGKDLGSFQVGEDWTQVVKVFDVEERKSGAVLRIWTSSGRVKVWIDDVELERLQ